MDAPQYTGSLEELPDILESWGARELLVAWRDAAVARHLAEAGAVHPAVHTPTRVMQWLERHGWERAGGSPLVVRWTHALGENSSMDVRVPVDSDTIDYARRIREVLQDGTLYDGTPMSQVLAEVAAMPEEWA